jgi:hypothetical protein
MARVRRISSDFFLLSSASASSLQADGTTNSNAAISYIYYIFIGLLDTGNDLFGFPGFRSVLGMRIPIRDRGMDQY